LTISLVSSTVKVVSSVTFALSIFVNLEVIMPKSASANPAGIAQGVLRGLTTSPISPIPGINSRWNEYQNHRNAQEQQRLRQQQQPGAGVRSQSGSSSSQSNQQRYYQNCGPKGCMSR
jgi:hypothetical protein